MLERIGLEVLVLREVVHAAPQGTVLSQEPAEGTLMDAGSIVQLVVSSGQTIVPELSGLRYAETVDALKRAKLAPGKISEIPVEATDMHNRIASQLPVAGERVAENSAVDLVLYVPLPPGQTANPTSTPGGQ